MEHQINLNKLYEELKRIERSMVTRDEMNSFIETIEILSNPETMNQICSSKKDIEIGNVKEINSVSDF